MKTLVIKWQRLLDDQEETCPRCSTTEQEVERAVEELNYLLKQRGVAVSLVKKAIDQEIFKRDVLQSNKILIAGKAIEDWVGAKTGQSKCCETCGDAECRTVEYAGETHEAVPADLIVQAGLIAAAQIFDLKLPQIARRKPIVKIMLGRTENNATRRIR
jgi:hypothetical protein